MRNFKKFRPMRSRTFRSLLLVAGVFLFTAALAPKANAQNVLIYFNFEDVAPNVGTYDDQADVQGAPDFNPGGGVQLSTLSDNFGSNKGTVAGTTVNRTFNDIDTSTLRALGLRTTPVDNGHWIQFSFDATAFSNMSLSFACNTAGNGFNSATLSYSTDGGTTFHDIGSQPLLAGGGFNTVTFANNPAFSAIDHAPSVILRLTFTGGTSSGNNLQTVIDNIQLTGVPEPTTVAGGLLGVLGLCWHQRRRLIRSVRFRRT